MSRIVEVEPGALAGSYGSASLELRHDLVGHPLLTLDAVVDAATRVPDHLVEHNFGTVPTVLPDGTAPRLSESPGEIARNIEANRCWMVLRWIHVLPEYASLRDELFESLAALVPGVNGLCEAYLFLSAPDTTTPTHCDTEQNVLCQVQGRKTFHLGRHPDEETKQRQLEMHGRLGGRNLPYLPVDPHRYELGPGDALYVAPEAPHWVGNGPEVSISFSLVWHPRELIRARRVHSFNHALRARGRAPRPPGSSPVVDRVKSGLVWAQQLMRRIVGLVKPRRDA